MPAPTKAPPLSDLTLPQRQWIGGGFLLMIASLGGQTILIAQFGEPLRAEFSLSHTQYGLLYTLGTLVSAGLIIWAGGFADRVPARKLALVCLLGLALVSAGMSIIPVAPILGLGFFGLRFFGQGMLAHLSMTTMTRWFDRFRGRALAITQFGFSLGEALLPVTLTLAIAAWGWRLTWLAVAAVFIVLIAPALAFLLRATPDESGMLGRINPAKESAPTHGGTEWTRKRVLADPLFFALVLGPATPAFCMTAILIHQATMIEDKGWDLLAYTGLFPIVVVTAMITTFAAGALVDRVGAHRLVPIMLMPICGIGLILAYGQGFPAMVMFLVLFGMNSGMFTPIVGAIWAELYGTAHLGSIRALVQAGSVFGSALGPGISGGLIDAGVPLSSQGPFIALWCAALASLYLLIGRQTASRAALHQI